MSQTEGMKKNSSILMFIAAVAAIIYFAGSNFTAFKNVFVVALGFGVVIMIHEFGHFITAKLSGIKVEVFSIGFPPVLLGISRTTGGIRVRILPQLFTKDNDPDGDGLLSFTFGKSGRAGETEYRIGLVPFGGYVKMLGQEDTGPVEQTNDPRSFVNKSLFAKVAVVAAGVIFNAISAVIIFMIVFLAGVKLPAAVVGSVRPESPAAIAGITAGDTIIEIDGEKFIDFSSLPLAAALSKKGQPVEMKVRHIDGSIEKAAIIAEKPQEDVGMRIFGIGPEYSLTVGDIADKKQAEYLEQTTGLRPRDTVKAINGRDVGSGSELDSAISNILKPTAVLMVERMDSASGSAGQVAAEIRLDVPATNDNFKKGYELAHICSMVPRMKIFSAEGPAKSVLQAGDIIAAVAETANPTYAQLREITTKYEGKELTVTVLRQDNGALKPVTVTVKPHKTRGTQRVVIGVAVMLDMEHAVVGQTIQPEDGSAALEIPAGAAITAVDGEAVSDFYQVIDIIRKNAGQRISIDWRVDEQTAGDAMLDTAANKNCITVKTMLANEIPFESLRQTYKAAGAIEAVRMGFQKTYMYIAQTYVTLQRLAGRDVSPDTLVGPVGIVKMSYDIVSKQPFTYYVYFLGLISSCIAVMNLLPLPIVDGGVIVLLIFEKIKGSPLSKLTQEIISYAGLALIGSVFLYLTYNDVLKFFFGR